jgi:hypothetical protein
MRRWLLLVIAANLIGLATLVFAYPQFMVAPGALVSAHSSLAKDCFACHAPFQGAQAGRCVTCHKVADLGLRTTKGVAMEKANKAPSFHQSLSVQTCTACHTDHGNPSFTPRTQLAFAHALLSPPIRDNCVSCHAAPVTVVHTGATSQCTQCHSQNRWKPATFDHAKFFVLDKDHNADCATCHTTSDPRQYTCYGCHEHTEANVRTKHLREGIRNFTDCVSCHRSAHGGDREGGRQDGGKRKSRDRD